MKENMQHKRVRRTRNRLKFTFLAYISLPVAKLPSALVPQCTQPALPTCRGTTFQPLPWPRSPGLPAFAAPSPQSPPPRFSQTRHFPLRPWPWRRFPPLRRPQWQRAARVRRHPWRPERRASRLRGLSGPKLKKIKKL